MRHSDALANERGQEGGLPNYRGQQRYNYIITIRQRCHPRIPGHLIDLLNDETGIEKEDIGRYFEIEDVSTLSEALLKAYLSTGNNPEKREKIYRSSMQIEMNPRTNHARKTLQVAPGYQWDIERWQSNSLCNICIYKI